MDIKMCSFPCRWVCWPTRWRLRERRFEIWTCVWKSTGRNLTPPRRCCNRCVYFIRDKASFWDSDDHFMYLYISSHYNGVHAVVPVYSAGTVYLTATKQYFFVLQIKKKVVFLFFYSAFAGASVQNFSGDPEAWTDVWSVHPQAEAELYGQGKIELRWQI